MATEVLTQSQNFTVPIEPNTQIRIQFTTNLADFKLPESTGPILVPTSTLPKSHVKPIHLTRDSLQISVDMAFQLWSTTSSGHNVLRHSTS